MPDVIKLSLKVHAGCYISCLFRHLSLRLKPPAFHGRCINKYDSLSIYVWLSFVKGSDCFSNCAVCSRRLHNEASSISENKVVRKRVTVRISRLEIAFVWRLQTFTFLCFSSSVCGSVYIWSWRRCVCVYFMLMEERAGQGGQVQGTALCLRGYPCWGNVFKIYYPHS